MNFFALPEYLKYILFSQHKKGHGIHSPFVFDLVTKVLRNKTDDDIVRNIEDIRKRLQSDHRIIQVTDLGSGSKKLKTNKRRVSDITRYATVPKKYGLLLLNLAREFGKPAIVELGTSVGISTLYMAAGSPESMVYTIEGCPATSEIAKKNFHDAGITNIKIFTGSFEENIPEIIGSGLKPGMIFIDGNHRKEPVIEYFNKMASVSDSKTVIIIDDIYSSRGMKEAWNEIKTFEKVTLTVDIYRMGIVFFRKGMNRNHYIIRY
jgi:predicted O-methyltransferase YrrM